MQKQAAPVTEKSIIWLVAAVQFINIVDFMMVMPLGPDLAKGLGMQSSAIGYITAAYTFAAATVAIISAAYIDRFRRKPALLFATAGLSAATLAAALAHNTEQLLIARILAGCFAGPATSIAMSLLIDHIPVERRGRAMGKVMGAFSVAAVMGVPLGMQLTIWFSWQAPFVLIGSAGLVVTAVVMWLLPRGEIPNSSGKNVSLGPLLRQPAVGFSYLMTGAGMLAGFLLIPNFSTYFQFNLDYPREHIGTLYLVGGIASFFVLRIAGALVDRFGSTGVGWLAWFCSASIVYLTFVLLLDIPLWLVFVVFMSANAMRNVAIQALASQVPSASTRGAYMSLQSATRHIATGCAAWGSSLILVSGHDQKLQHFDSLAWMTIIISLLVPIAMHLTQYKIIERDA
ncbi:MAG: MFS transporter [Pseudomonadales bacterium]|nr:MFS transporter [Pseudomonadales bacterium]